MRVCYRRLLPAVVGALVQSAVAGSQVVRGSVIVQGDSAPVTGAVILVLDPANVVQARALTDDHGRFAIQIRGPPLSVSVRCESDCARS
jgi:hypothetical protein